MEYFKICYKWEAEQRLYPHVAEEAEEALKDSRSRRRGGQEK